jgi:hypothetical protein
MRHGRAKQARKTLQFFARITHHKIRPPYSILLDGTFLVAVMQYKLHDEMTSRLHRLLQQHEHHDHGGEASSMIHLLTTRSTLIELQKLEQAVATKGGAEKALVFQQARAWAEANCMRILEKDDVPDESSSIDVSSIPTTPSSVIQKQQQHGNNNKKRARGGGGGIGDVSLVGREFLRLAMAVLVQEEDDEDEKANEKSVTAATASSTKEAGEESASTKEHGEGSGSSRKQGQKRRDGKRQIPKHQNHHHHHHQKHQHCYYFVASQDEQVLDRLRHLGHVPIIRLARGSVLLLEQPSKAATQQAWREERLKWRLGIGGAGTATAAGGTSNKGGAATVAASAATSSMLQQERNEAQRLVKEERQERRREQQQQQQQQQPYAARHKKRAKGPNPLSCKPGAKKKQKT